MKPNHEYRETKGEDEHDVVMAAFSFVMDFLWSLGQSMFVQALEGVRALWWFAWTVLPWLYLVWRADKFVIWKPGVGVHVPTWRAYSKQHALAAQVRHAAYFGRAASPSNAYGGGAVHGSQNSFSVMLASSTDCSGGCVQVTLRSTSNFPNSTLGHFMVVAAHLCDCLCRPVIIMDPFLSFGVHLLTQCWWPRACHAVVNYAQLPVRLVTAVGRTVGVRRRKG